MEEKRMLRIQERNIRIPTWKRYVQRDNENNVECQTFIELEPSKIQRTYPKIMDVQKDVLS